MKDYYRILGIKPTATESEIKSAYRVLAKKYHPDVNPGDATAASKFADINEANSVLADPKARAEYDAKIKEHASGQPSREDIIARQRAQAQAAARQAAYRNNMNMGGMGGMGGMRGSSAARDATIARARAAQQAQAQAAANAQMQVLVNQAFQQGVLEARAQTQTEISRLNAKINELLAENKRLMLLADELGDYKRQLAVAEQDRRELEQELFSRDRDSSLSKQRIKELEERLDALRSECDEMEFVKSENDRLKEAVKRAKRAENDERRLEEEKETLINETAKQRAEYYKLEETIKQLEQEKKQLELTMSAQMQLQHDKRKKLQEENEELHRKLAELNTEMETLREENERWQQYAESEDFLSDADRRIQEWNKKVSADKKLAKTTIYNELGLLVWATDEEIEQAYSKLAKKLGNKAEPELVAKFEKIENAYKILSDHAAREEYNASIGITKERIEEERKLREENEGLIREYNDRLADKEFWAKFDDLSVSALAGDAESQYTLGNMYYTGEEIDRDVDQAAYWFKEASKQMHPEAMCALGVCFLNGEGVDKNEGTGMGFIRQAAKHGSKTAEKLLKQQTGGDKK